MEEENLHMFFVFEDMIDSDLFRDAMRNNDTYDVEQKIMFDTTRTLGMEAIEPDESERLPDMWLLTPFRVEDNYGILSQSTKKIESVLEILIRYTVARGQGEEDGIHLNVTDLERIEAMSRDFMA